MRWLYTLLWLLGLPFAFLYLLWRARRQPEYLRHWPERLGFVALPDDRPVIWLHAVSVGETRAAAPLIHALLARQPDHVLLLTHATPTGRATGQALFGDAVTQAYLPYDLPWLVRRFLTRTRPVLGIVMETEVWPSLYAECAQHGVPLFLVNARLSGRSARGYRRFGRLARPALASLTGIAAQTEADAARLRELGARQVTVCGNLKFDVAPPPDTEARAAELRRAFAGRFVWLAASTRDGEEALLLDVLAQLDLPDLLLVIVPRHPQRFDAVARLIETRGLNCPRRSQGGAPAKTDRVFLGDSMGEMAAYAQACDLAVIGGSLLPFGGQNPIEIAAAGKPMLLGPHTWNFEDISEEAVRRGAARRIQDAEALAQAVRELFEAAAVRNQMGEAGMAFAQGHRGATERILQLLR
ncbi:MAG: lipid IV(A) 3-deoxy-D-manno-octulosonic acid transferase [Betaproteobacteria bacterium]|nr:lipid IV(A) 3-deoxy-D-manno-octulosonic acid transferase [Betaproteobacteria bacterium]